MKSFKKLTCILLTIVMLVGIAAFPTAAQEAVPAEQTTASLMANVVVFVRFADDTSDVFNGTDEYGRDNHARVLGMYDDMSGMNQYGIDCSFKAYIAAVFNGHLNVENTFPQNSESAINTLTLANSRSYYTDDFEVLEEVIAASNNGTLTLPAGKYDHRESGVMDNLTVLIQGGNNGTDDELMYPHKSVAFNTARFAGSYLVRNYNFIDTDSLYRGQQQGVITHEFLHSVGLPDLYRRFTTGSPVGTWDIMAGTASFMQYPLTYMRAGLGWLDTADITAAGSYTLDPSTSQSGNLCYIIRTPMSDTEFFVIEYRKKVTDNPANLGFETKIPDSGLLVYRVNTAIDDYTNAAGEDYI